MRTEIRENRFDPWLEVTGYQQQHDLGSMAGATCVFVGTMRDINEGDTVKEMHLEHYPGMTENYLARIANEANTRWDILDLLILHRVGRLSPSEPIVVVAVWAEHRAHAYEANRFLMEQLKASAPFWKKETLDDDTQRWVTRNTSGHI